MFSCKDLVNVNKYVKIIILRGEANEKKYYKKFIYMAHTL